MVIGLLRHTGRFHLNSSPFSITLNLISVAEASDSESVVESLLETSHDEEGDFLFLFRLKRFSLLLFLSISSESELEDVPCLLFRDLLFCLSTFLFREGFGTFALDTSFSAGSSGESPALPLSFRPVSLSEFTTRGIKLCLRRFCCSESLLESFCDIVEILWKLSWDKFLQKINCKSSTDSFTNKVEREWSSILT